MLSILLSISSSQARTRVDENADHLEQIPPARRPSAGHDLGQISEFRGFEGQEINSCSWGQKPTLVVITSNLQKAPSFLSELTALNDGQIIVLPVTKARITTALRLQARKDTLKLLARIQPGIPASRIKVGRLISNNHDVIKGLKLTDTDFTVALLDVEGRVQKNAEGRLLVWPHADSEVTNEISTQYRQQLSAFTTSAQNGLPPNRCPAMK